MAGSSAAWQPMRACARRGAGFQQVLASNRLPGHRLKHHINNPNEGAISPDTRRRSTPVRTPPIYSLPEHRELLRCHPHSPVLGAWPRETATFQHLLIETKPLTIPIQQLDPVTTPPTECEHRTTGRLLMQHILCQPGQPRGLFAHILHTTGQIHANTSPGTDRAASTARISTDSAVGSIVL